MICPNCQTEMPDGVKFCPSCGSSVAAAVSDSVMPVEAAIEQIPSVDEKISSEMPNGSFDPGAPIAIPKKKEEPQIVENVEAAAPVETVPEVAPVESVLPEYPQTPAAPVAPAPNPAAGRNRGRVGSTDSGPCCCTCTGTAYSGYGSCTGCF